MTIFKECYHIHYTNGLDTKVPSPFNQSNRLIDYQLLP